MENILLIILCLVVGVLLKMSRLFPPLGHQALNQFIIYISLPALALYHIPKLQLDANIGFPLGIAWLGFGLSFLFFSLLGKVFHWPKKLTGSLIIMAGLGNTSFVGFPVIEAAYGKQALSTAIVVDQAGSFVVVSTLAVMVAAFYSGKNLQPLQVFQKILLFPPFIAFAFGVLLMFLQVDFPTPLQSVWQRLGNTVTPIALISVGLQLHVDFKSKHWKFLFLGLFFKLLVTPAFFYVLYVLVLNGSGLPVRVALLESAMAPMITGAILATTNGLKPKLAAMMVGVGIPLSLLTLWLWYTFFATV